LCHFLFQINTLFLRKDDAEIVKMNTKVSDSFLDGSIGSK